MPSGVPPMGRSRRLPRQPVITPREGRVHANGRGFVPFIRGTLYEQLQDLAKAQGIETNERATKDETNSSLPADSSHAKSAHDHRLPKTWDDIQTGDLVLSQDTDPEDGWWEAIVVRKAGTLFT